MADTVARRSYGKLVAFLAACTRDVAAAEDALSEAFAAALTDWPRNGCPENPEAWLMTVARRKAIEVARKRFTGETVAGQLQILAEGLEAAAAEHGEIPDRRLALLFACAHLAIDAGVRAPLMLQVVVGLDAKTIASAFLMSPGAMDKGLARPRTSYGTAAFRSVFRNAKNFPVGSIVCWKPIYAAFAEGWSDPGAADVVRRDLTSEAMFLARVVTELLPDEPEALGLLAFLLHAEARRRARRNANVEYVPLAEQDSALWDWEMIGEAEAVIRRASALGPSEISIGDCAAIGACLSLPHG